MGWGGAGGELGTRAFVHTLWDNLRSGQQSIQPEDDRGSVAEFGGGYI